MICVSHGGHAISELLVTTSWDDGHPADRRVADLLERHGANGTFYVPCRNAEGRPVMRPSDIRLVAGRFEIGGHTRDHVSLTQLPPQAAEQQIDSNKSWLQDLLGHEVTGFAYVRGHHNRTVRRLVQKAGFRYARTVRNLSGATGPDRYRVPTTIQFFAHPDATYWRNYVSGGTTLQRLALLRAVLGERRLAERVLKAACSCRDAGQAFHLWGHSWELDEYNLWDELDRCLGRLRDAHARFVSNAAWCADCRIAGSSVTGCAP